MTEITTFTGKYRFLSNFSLSRVVLGGETYPTVEHAYQAAKTLDLADRQRIRRAPTAGEAKRLGRRMTLRPNWEDEKLAVMEDLLRQKFAYGDLRAALVQTGDATLVEGNDWGDRYWGVCRGVGLNNLGLLLMQIRSELIS